MLFTNLKPTIDTQKLRRKKQNHTTKKNHQTTMEESNRKRAEETFRNIQKTNNKR